MEQATPRPRGNTATACSFVCVAGAALWLPLCFFLFVTQSDPGNWLAGPAGLFFGVIGACALSLLGTAFGVVAVFGADRKGWAGLALALNALVFFGTGIPLFLFFGWPH